MVRIKPFLYRIFPKEWKNGPPEEKFDHAVTIDESEEGNEITKTMPVKCGIRTKNCLGFFIDVLFCVLITMMWIAALSFIVKYGFGPQGDNVHGFHYFHFSYFIVLLIVSLSGIHSETAIMRGFDRLVPRVAVISRKPQPRKSYILRIRTLDDKEYIETEIDQTKLTFTEVLQLCAKELEVEKDQITRLYKYPETRIRSDEDVKRFKLNRIVYIKVKM